MTRLFTILMTLWGILAMPASDAWAFWLSNDGQCVTDTAAPDAMESVDVELSGEPTTENCASVTDPSDSSYNACFELAEHPISTLPELIAQGQAERLAAMLVETTDSVATPQAQPLLPSPNEASVEDPAAPGQPLVAARAIPRPRPNACAVYPDDCESAPVTPILNLEAAGPQAASSTGEFELPPPIDIPELLGPPSPGLGPAAGVVTRLDRPPQFR